VSDKQPVLNISQATYHTFWHSTAYVSNAGFSICLFSQEWKVRSALICGDRKIWCLTIEEQGRETALICAGLNFFTRPHIVKCILCATERKKSANFRSSPIDDDRDIGAHTNTQLQNGNDQCEIQTLSDIIFFAPACREMWFGLLFLLANTIRLSAPVLFLPHIQKLILIFGRESNFRYWIKEGHGVAEAK
jgi:hypothetical protein